MSNKQGLENYINNLRLVKKSVPYPPVHILSLKLSNLKNHFSLNVIKLKAGNKVVVKLVQVIHLKESQEIGQHTLEEINKDSE